MPFQSEKQRRYLWANEPEIARDWTDTYGSRIQKAGGQLVQPGAGRPGYGGPQDWGQEAREIGPYAPPDRGPDRGPDKGPDRIKSPIRKDVNGNFIGPRRPSFDQRERLTKGQYKHYMKWIDELVAKREVKEKERALKNQIARIENFNPRQTIGKDFGPVFGAISYDPFKAQEEGYTTHLGATKGPFSAMYTGGSEVPINYVDLSAGPFETKVGSIAGGYSSLNDVGSIAAGHGFPLEGGHVGIGGYLDTQGEYGLRALLKKRFKGGGRIGQLVQPRAGRPGYGGPQDWGAEAKGTGAYAPPDRDRGWSPGVGGTQHIPKKPERQTIRGIKPSRDTGIQTLSPFSRHNKLSQLGSLAGNWSKWWGLPPEIKKALASGKAIEVGHGFKKAIDKTKGFSEFRNKVLPTLDDWARGGWKGVRDFGKGLLQAPFVTDPKWNVPKSQGVFVGSPNVASTYATEGGMRGTQLAKKGTDIAKGFIDPREAKWSRSMLGHVQGVVPASVANRFSGMGGKTTNFMKAAPIGGLSKFVGAAMPGLNTIMGATRAMDHFRQGDYGQSLMAGISAIPGPVGWAGLAGEAGLGALSNLTFANDAERMLPENTLVMNQGGIAWQR